MAGFCLAKRNTTLTNTYNNISNERLNRVNLISSSPTCSTFLDKVEESKLVAKEQQEKEKEVNRRKVPSPCRSDLRPLEVV